MSTESTPAPQPPPPQGWTAERYAAALAVAQPNDRRVAEGAARLLRMQDHVGDFAAWCDAHVARPAEEGAP